MKVSILETCTGCGACATINSDVFEVNEIAHVNFENIDGNEQDCYDAAMACPVNAIIVEED